MFFLLWALKNYPSIQTYESDWLEEIIGVNVQVLGWTTCKDCISVSHILTTGIRTSIYVCTTVWLKLKQTNWMWLYNLIIMNCSLFTGQFHSATIFECRPTKIPCYYDSKKDYIWEIWNNDARWYHLLTLCLCCYYRSFTPLLTNIVCLYFTGTASDDLTTQNFT